MTTKRLFTMGMAALMLAGCNHDDSLRTVDLKTPINLQLSVEGPVVNTRADVAGNNFKTGDEVGLFLGTSETETAADFEAITDSKHRNVEFTREANGWDGTLYWQSTRDWHTLYAYAPYDKELETNGTTMAYTISNDQQDPADYAAADLLHYVSLPMKATADAVPVS